MVDTPSRVDAPRFALKDVIAFRRKFLFSLVMFSCSILLVATVAESWLRWQGGVDPEGWYERVDDPVLFYRLSAGRSGHSGGWSRTQAAQHVRGLREYAQRPTEGVARALWIGDSACFGTGVDDEHTAPAQFEELAESAGIAVEAINLGVEGYNVRQVREVLAQRSTEFAGAGLVVYYHHENDIVNAPLAWLAPYLPGELYWAYEPPQGAVRKLAKRSALVRRMWDVALTWRRSSGSLDDIPSMDAREVTALGAYTEKCLPLYSSDSSYGSRFGDELDAMKAMCQRMKAPLMVVYWPTRGLRTRPEADRLRHTLAEWCQRRDILFVDTTEAFRAAADAGLYADSIHPGVAGQRIIAQAVLRQWQSLSEAAGAVSSTHD